jgi:hypothetical protein
MLDAVQMRWASSVELSKQLMSVFLPHGEHHLVMPLCFDFVLFISDASLTEYLRSSGDPTALA